MKTRTFSSVLLLLSILEIAALFFFALQETDNSQDAVLINECLHCVQDDWTHMQNHQNKTSLDYVALDAKGAVLFRTKPDLSESVHEAILHRDTILDVQSDGSAAGKLIINNDSPKVIRTQKQRVIFFLCSMVLLQCMVCLGHALYLNHTIVRPFHALEGFAKRVAGGNLDIPLEMDRENLFGAFTESFDIMRSELKKAKIAEAKANACKNDLVARLSHDIKTPVASIKAASEVGAALADSEKTKNNYLQIIRKADQINTLITDLFAAALEELEELSVIPEDFKSEELKKILENSNYPGLAEIPRIPGCILYADRLRLQQVFDNLFANSYKYAGTKIDLSLLLESSFLVVSIEDYGGGAAPEDLPHLKEKFRRGSRTEAVEGAGLGLYISDYLMREMHGELALENGKNGLKAMVKIPLSGTI